ncbi:MAG: SPOR domain-containing protein [Hyphomicrobiales bacterium]
MSLSLAIAGATLAKAQPMSSGFLREPAAKLANAAPRGEPEKLALVPFEASPFPYHGEIPEEGKPFLDVEGRGHTSPRGGVYFETPTYSDRRALLYIPKGFDIRRPAVMVFYFHGNLATLERDVRNRQQVPRQVAQSGLNAVLVAPQFAVDALDSSAGHFWQPRAFERFLDEAATHLANLYGDEGSRGVFAAMPVVMVAYSGGDLAAGYSLSLGGAEGRVRGVVLLDALFNGIDKFAQWITRHSSSTFFFSAYSQASRGENAALTRFLTERKVQVRDGMPAALTPGVVTFLSAGAAVHNDFVSRAWVADPLKAVLAKVGGFPRTGETVASPQAAPADAPPASLPAAPNVAAPPVGSTPPTLQKFSARPVDAPMPLRATQPGPAVADRTFAVQLASPLSEREAQDAVARLQAQCPTALQSRRTSIIRAEVDGKIHYRVRVQGLSPGDAGALCKSLKSEGCDCQIAKS